MVAIPTKIKCSKCGHKYTLLVGGFIVNSVSPKECPNCGYENNLNSAGLFGFLENLFK